VVKKPVPGIEKTVWISIGPRTERISADS